MNNSRRLEREVSRSPILLAAIWSPVVGRQGTVECVLACVRSSLGRMGWTTHQTAAGIGAFLATAIPLASAADPLQSYADLSHYEQMMLTAKYVLLTGTFRSSSDASIE